MPYKLRCCSTMSLWYLPRARRAHAVFLVPLCFCAAAVVRTLRDEDAADAPLRGAACSSSCRRACCSGAIGECRVGGAAAVVAEVGRLARTRIPAANRAGADARELAATDAPETPPSVMLVAAPRARQVRALLRGAGRGYGPAAGARRRAEARLTGGSTAALCSRVVVPGVVVISSVGLHGCPADGPNSRTPSSSLTCTVVPARASSSRTSASRRSARAARTPAAEERGVRLSRDAHGMHMAAARASSYSSLMGTLSISCESESISFTSRHVLWKKRFSTTRAFSLPPPAPAAAAQAQQLGFALGRLLLSAHRPQLALRIGEGRAQLLRLARERLVLLSELRAAHLELELGLTGPRTARAARRQQRPPRARSPRASGVGRRPAAPSRSARARGPAPG